MARSISQKAKAFIQWREIKRIGDSVRWRCSYSDISRETGIHLDTVRSICLRNGWRCRDEDAIRVINRTNRLSATEDIYSIMQSSLDRASCHV